MRNGRDRRSENPFWATAKKERVLLVGTDQRITSGPAATAAASWWSIYPPRDNRPNTWLHPNASQKSQIPLAPRAPSIHGPKQLMSVGQSMSALPGYFRRQFVPLSRGHLLDISGVEDGVTRGQSNESGAKMKLATPAW